MSSMLVWLSSMMRIRVVTRVSFLVFRQDQRKPAPFSVFAFHSDAAAQQISQLLAQMQAQAGSFRVLLTFGVEPGKRTKKLGLVIRADAYARVRYGDLRGGRAIVAPLAGFQSDRTILRELDGVVRQVDQNLA